jgi:tetratricopeptide (TPR) repeat protein
MSYSRKDFKAAHRFLKRALDQAQRARGLREDDVAAMDSVSSALAFHEGNYDEAVACIQRSINLWTHAHGPSAPSLGLGYALRAQALAKTGDYRRAVADAQHALAVIDAAYGRDNTAYLHMQMVYSQILRGAGQKQQASQLQRQASRSLADLSSLQCAGCTINANGFR